MNDIPNPINPMYFYNTFVLPIYFDDSLDSYQKLLKIQYKINEIIKNQTGIIEWLNQLKKWVDTQLEMYVKEQLNAWLADGTLEKLINDILFNTKVSVVETTMELLNTRELKDGITYRTLGYSTQNDGGGALFTVTNENTDFVSIDGKNLELILSEDLNILMYGCRPNTDITSRFQKAVDYAHEKGFNVLIPAFSFNVSKTINVHGGMKISGTSIAITNSGLTGSLIVNTGTDYTFKYGLDNETNLYHSRYGGFYHLGIQAPTGKGIYCNSSLELNTVNIMDCGTVLMKNPNLYLDLFRIDRCHFSRFKCSTGDSYAFDLRGNTDGLTIINSQFESPNVNKNDPINLKDGMGLSRCQGALISGNVFNMSISINASGGIEMSGNHMEHVEAQIYIKGSQVNITSHFKSKSVMGSDIYIDSVGGLKNYVKLNNVKITPFIFNRECSFEEIAPCIYNNDPNGLLEINGCSIYYDFVSLGSITDESCGLSYKDTKGNILTNVDNKKSIIHHSVTRDIPKFIIPYADNNGEPTVTYRNLNWLIDSNISNYRIVNVVDIKRNLYIYDRLVTANEMKTNNNSVVIYNTVSYDATLPNIYRLLVSRDSTTNYTEQYDINIYGNMLFVDNGKNINGFDKTTPTTKIYGKVNTFIDYGMYAYYEADELPDISNSMNGDICYKTNDGYYRSNTLAWSKISV